MPFRRVGTQNPHNTQNLSISLTGASIQTSAIERWQMVRARIRNLPVPIVKLKLQPLTWTHWKHAIKTCIGGQGRPLPTPARAHQRLPAPASTSDHTLMHEYTTRTTHSATSPTGSMTDTVHASQVQVALIL